MISSQSIRPSQFIFTYGPGSILETLNGPVLIPLPEHGLFGGSFKIDPNDYEIVDERMTKYLMSLPNKPQNITDCKIFRLPRTAEVGGSNSVIYNTREFPTWKLCTNRKMPGHSGLDILYKDHICPVCQDRYGGRKYTIRFVMACSRGHLDDVDWDYLVHGNNKCTRVNSVTGGLDKNTFFQWRRDGGALKNNTIVCPRCGRDRNLASAFYDRTLRCSGRNPEKESVNNVRGYRPSCTENANMMLRQSANVRISEIRTLLKIQSVFTSLHNLIQSDKGIHSLLKAFLGREGPIDSPTKLERLIKDLENGGVPISKIREFKTVEWGEVSRVADSIVQGVPNSYHGSIIEEYKELIFASKNGAPPDPSKVRSSIQFLVNKHKIVKVKSQNGRTFVITPVDVLRTITVTVGFTRPVSEQPAGRQPHIVSVASTDPNNGSLLWYPGVSFLGEGIFISLEEEWTDLLAGNAVASWLKSHSASADYEDFVFRDPLISRDELHPGFVWWHTLSHLIIRAVGEESGYSAASIRERVYLEKINGKTRGGILLYAAQPGDGTLGGLVGMVPNFRQVLYSALEKSHNCSADPLCSEQKFKHLEVNGSCCYGCLMNSETSCEHRNMWLDRTVLRENIP